jgi:hypothetical protein
MDGSFGALDAQTGKVLWNVPLAARWHSSPMSYAVDGKQYVAVRSAIPCVTSGVMAFGLVLEGPFRGEFHLFCFIEICRDDASHAPWVAGMSSTPFFHCFCAAGAFGPDADEVDYKAWKFRLYALHPWQPRWAKAADHPPFKWRRRNDALF